MIDSSNTQSRPLPGNDGASSISFQRHPPVPSKPLGQRRNRRLTGSTGSGGPSAIDVAIGNGPIIPEALQTETPRTLTLQDDTHHEQHDVHLPSFSTIGAADMLSQKLSQIGIAGHATADTASPNPGVPNRITTPVHPDDMGISHIPETSKHGPLGPSARLAFEDAVKWKRRKKAGKVLIDLPDQNLLSQLRGRDHVS